MLGAGFKPVVRYFVSQVGSTPTGFRQSALAAPSSPEDVSGTKSGFPDWVARHQEVEAMGVGPKQAEFEPSGASLPCAHRQLHWLRVPDNCPPRERTG